MTTSTGSGIPPADQSGDTLPRQIGRFRILGPLGSGGMGKVYKAHDPQLNRVVALKLPHFDGPADKRQQRLQRFQREGQAAARVWHANVCPIYDVGEHDGQPYVVMAFVEGRSLEEVLKEVGRFEDVGQAVALVLQILDGLGAIHTAGLIHRDVKPSNVIIDKQGRAYVVDFGLARPDQEGEGLTSDSVIVGTPSYMAPEQAGGRPDQVGPWTDLYGLGVVFYRMVTGRIPFEGPPLAVLGRILHEPVPPPSQFRPDLDRGIEDILLKAAAKEPAGRFQNAGQFADALRGWSARPLPHSANQEKPDTDTATDPVPASNNLPFALMRRRKLRIWIRLLLASGICALLSIGCYTLAALHYGASPDLLGAFGIIFLGPAVSIFVASLMSRANFSPQRLLRLAGNPKADGGVETAQSALALLRDGVPVDHRDTMGETALMKAAQSGNIEMAKLLLLHGADCTLRNQFGQTALMIAVATNHQDVVDLLKQARALD